MTEAQTAAVTVAITVAVTETVTLTTPVPLTTTLATNAAAPVSLNCFSLNCCCYSLVAVGLVLIVNINWFFGRLPAGDAFEKNDTTVCSSYSLTTHSTSATTNDTEEWKYSFGTEGFPVYEPSVELDKCIQLVESDPKETTPVENPRQTKILIKYDEQIRVNCKDVFKRGNYSRKGDPAFSIAHLRVVYRDYHLQELILNLLYSTTNVFCYAVDRKATDIFKQQMRNLSECFPNVYIASTSYSIDSAGHNMDRAFLSCMYGLRDIPVWRYAITMQNYDIPIKTDEEMQEIVRALNGSNSVGLTKPLPKRIPHYENWTLAALKLFKDKSQNDQRRLEICKGNIGSVYSREFVEFLVDKLDPNIFLKRLDEVGYGNDEMFFPTLNANHILGMPGGFTVHCMGANRGYIARYVSWQVRQQQCRSKNYRHSICVYGVDDLPVIRQQKHLFANKMMPEYDYTAIVCWAKYLAYRSAIPDHQLTLDLNHYATAPSVLFNENREYWLKNIDKFNCTSAKV